MTQKLKIAIVSLTIITIVSGYFLWQIDRHEKALLGQEWLNPVPYLTWQKFLTEQKNYEKAVRNTETEYANIITLIDGIKQSDSQKPPLSKMYTGSLYFTAAPKDYLSIHGFYKFVTAYPNEYQQFGEVKKELEKIKPIEPKPSNPPKPVIQQAINSYYRSMITVDAISIIGLVVFLVFYKDS